MEFSSVLFRSIEIDAMLLTLDHADRCHGIDDVRQIFHHRGKPVPGYARRETLAHLRRRFGYVFDGRDGYPATIEGDVLADAMIVGDIRIKTVDQPNGNIFSTGFRFETIGSSISYSTDFHVFTDAMLELFSRTDIWEIGRASGRERVCQYV